MKRTCFLSVFLITVFILLVSCSQPRTLSDKVDEPEAAQKISRTVLPTQVVETGVTATPAADYSITTSCLHRSSAGEEVILTDPEIMVVQFYTLLDLGLYAEAYNFLSSSRPHPQSVEEFIKMQANSYQKVIIHLVEPYDIWAKENGRATGLENLNEKFLYVEITGWGEGKMSGAVPNGVLKQLFVKTVKESDSWKIFSISTDPYFR